METLLDLAIRYVKPATARSTSVARMVVGNNVTRNVRDRFSVFHSSSTGYFINNYGRDIYITFRSGMVARLPPDPTPFICGRNEQAIYYVVGYDGCNPEYSTYNVDICEADGRNMERSVVREMLTVAAKKQNNFNTCSNFDLDHLVYKYQVYDTGREDNHQGVYWADADVVITSVHPEKNRILHPYSQMFQSLLTSRPNVFNITNPGDKGISIDIKYVHVKDEVIYVPFMGTVLKVEACKDPNMEMGVHIYSNRPDLNGRLIDDGSSYSRFFFGLDELNHENGFYHNFDEAKYMATAKFDIVLKAASKVSALEFENRKNQLAEHQLKIQQLKESYALDMKLKELRQANTQKLRHQQETHDLGMGHKREEQDYKMKIAAIKEKSSFLDRFTDMLKNIGNLTQALVIFFGLAVKFMSS